MSRRREGGLGQGKVGGIGYWGEENWRIYGWEKVD